MYINTQTLQRTSESDIRAAFPNTSFPVPFVAPEGYALVFPSPPPEFNPITQRAQETAPVLTAKGHYEQQWEIVELFSTQAEKDAAIAADIEAKDLADAQKVRDKIEALWAAADRYVTSYISGVAIGILTIGVIQSKPKAMAVTGWSSAIWAEYYARKALVTIDSVDNLDYSTFGAMPYSVPEIQAEIGL